MEIAEFVRTLMCRGPNERVSASAPLQCVVDLTDVCVRVLLSSTLICMLKRFFLVFAAKVKHLCQLRHTYRKSWYYFWTEH